MTRSIYSRRRRERGPASVARDPDAASHRTRTIAYVSPFASATLVTVPTDSPSAKHRRSRTDPRFGATGEQDARGMSEVPHLRHRLLSQEAPLREIDRAFEPRLRGQRAGSEVRPHARDPLADPPGLDVPGGCRSQAPFPEASEQGAGRFAPGHHDVMADTEDRRSEDEVVVAVLGGCAAEDGDDDQPFAPVLQLDVGREHVRGEDPVDGLGLLGRLEEEEGAVVRPRDVEVCPDPPGGGEEQRPTALSDSQALRRLP